MSVYMPYLRSKKPEGVSYICLNPFTANNSSAEKKEQKKMDHFYRTVHGQHYLVFWRT